MSENQLWFSQNLLSYKDKIYHTEGYLRLSISTNTEDYKSFNPPILNFSISNNYQKSCILNIQNAEDLIESFELALKKLNGEIISVEKKYSKDTMVLFQIQVEKNSGERVVLIQLISNETDMTKIIVPLKPTFQSFLRRLRFFVENYDRLCSNLLLESIKYESVQTLNQIHGLVKGLPNQILLNNPSQERILDSRAPEQGPQNITSITLENFDKFIGPDASNIKIAEIENGKTEVKEKLVEIKSLFCEKILNWDLSVLEDKINTFWLKPDKIGCLYRYIEKEIFTEGTLINLFTADEFKSINYIPIAFSTTMINANKIHNSPIPSGVNVFYCDLNGRIKEENKIALEEMALDLFMFSGYIRTLRRRLESKLQGTTDNKSIFYMNFRCLFDPLYFSFLMMMKKDISLGSVLNRFKYFQQKGLFKKYDQLLRDYTLPGIEESDIRNFVDEFYMNIYDKVQNITDLHESWYNSNEVKLPSKNSFTLEQIINEVIPLEVSIRLGLQVTDKEVVTRFKQTHKISDEIFNYCVGKQKVKKDVVKEKKVSVLYRYIEKFKADLSDSYREEFLNFIKVLDNSKFDFSTNKFPLSEFDERFIKALYVWNPDNDPNMKTNFTHFSSLVESEVMTKDSILAISSSIGTEAKVDDFLSLLTE